MFRINAPDRLSIDSSADTFSSATAEFNTFRNELSTAVLDAKRIQMIRATIPNIRYPIPNYQLVFYYYELPTATTVPDATHLKAVRLYAPDYVPPSGFTAFTRMTNTVTPTELATLLTTASAAGGDDVTYNTLWVSGALTFTYSVATSRMSVTLNTSGKFFANAGWNDPIVQASQADATKIIQRLASGNVIQPYVLGYTLNLRTGFALSGTCAQPQRLATSVSFKVAQTTGLGIAAASATLADTNPCLVGTQCIYLYSTVVGNSGNASNNKKNLLAIIPVDVPSFGVIQYTATSLDSHALKVPREFYAVDIQMLDDANQPFLLPDSANVNIELAIRYD
jgi:hypothetical protein